MDKLWTAAEHNRVVGQKEAEYRLSLKRELRSRGILYDVLETTTSLEKKLEMNKND